MNSLVVESYLLLIRVEFILLCGTLHSLLRWVKEAQPSKAVRRPSQTVDDLCRAIDLACIFYPKPVLCLQRSAATTLLLRRNGADAKMTIGAQIRPFRSHAWVELNGAVINDKPYMREIYQVMESC
jgi:hypothetical protein